MYIDLGSIGSVNVMVMTWKRFHSFMPSWEDLQYVPFSTDDTLCPPSHWLFLVAAKTWDGGRGVAELRKDAK
jgi:hypothetical protein